MNLLFQKQTPPPTHSVAQKQPDELGIYDMTGNVWEYCSDWHMPYSTLRPCYINISREELPIKAKGFAHYIGTEKARVGVPNGSLMVEFY